MSRKPRPVCPTCGECAVRSETKFGIRHDCCGLWSWGNKPLADRTTHEARRAAHASFDVLWKSGRLSRGDAYKALARVTGWPESDCHMMHMPPDKALQVPAAVKRIWESLNKTTGATNA